MLQQEQPDDYVVGSGKSHTVQQWVEIAFDHAGLDWRKYVKVDPALFRPAEVDHLVADASKARRVLNWNSTVGFDQLVKMMVDADIESVSRGTKYKK